MQNVSLTFHLNNFTEEKLKAILAVCGDQSKPQPKTDKKAKQLETTPEPDADEPNIDEALEEDNSDGPTLQNVKDAFASFLKSKKFKGDKKAAMNGAKDILKHYRVKTIDDLKPETWNSVLEDLA